MNIANFKIRNRLLHNITNRPEQYENVDRDDPVTKKNKRLDPLSTHDDHHKFNDLISSFQTTMGSLLTQMSTLQFQGKPAEPIKVIVPQSQKKEQIQYEVQPRDRYVIIELPELETGKLDQKKLKRWLGDVCRETFSSAFNYFDSGKLNFEQSKVYASESILRNLILIQEKYTLNADDIKFLDNLMKYELFPYLKSKYPMTISKNGNKMLAKIIKKVDNSDLLANDLFSITDIKFQRRESQRYEDLIMKIINQITMRADQKSTYNKNETNFQDFQNFMTEIFQKVYEQVWTDSSNVENNIKSHLRIGSQQAKNRRQSVLEGQMIHMTAELQQKVELEKQKYKKQVQQYTDFMIGRKIPEQVELFTEAQIQSGALRIKSPAILRLLTKWCEQLWKKFEDPNYFYIRNQGFLSKQSKQIRVLSPRQKDFLAEQAQQLKKQIQKFLGQVMNQNYLQQFYQLQRELQDTSELHIEPLQKVCGKFSLKVADNLESFIIVYLNKLIHCLLTLSQRENQASQSDGNMIELLSFKIGDLLRCKISTKQRQIKKVYQQIQKVSALDQQKIKIIRIKNRLELGTNDILINIKFNSLIICQIQLAVINSSKTEFIKHSYNFNHYIYELQRSIFGPITEMCSVWKNFQGRTKQFQKLIDRQTPKRMNKIIEDSQCVKLKAEHFMQAEIYPFICSQCSKSYYHNTCIFDHEVCLNCYYWVCSYCKVRKCIQQQNLSQFLDDRQLIQYCKFWNPTAQKYLPDYGVLINITISGKQSIPFQKITYNSCDYLFRMLDEQFKLYKQVKTPKDRQKLSQTYLIFQLSAQKGSTLFTSDTKQIRQKYIIPESIKRGFKNQRQIVSIMDQDINEIDMSAFKNASLQEKQLIKSIEFSYTNLQNVQIISQDFSNLQILYIANNPIEDISALSKFQYLEKIYASMSKIKQIPQSFSCLKYLKQLNLSSCRLKQLPNNIDKFQTLVLLNASSNQIKQFSQVLSRHGTLQIIDLNQNGLSKMPEIIQNLSNLRKLMIEGNKLTNLPKDMSKMKKLKEMCLMNGKITQIPQTISTLKSIQYIDLSKNKIQKVYFGKPFSKLQHLKTINLQGNLLPTIDGSFKNLTFVQNIHLQKNQIANIKIQFFNLEYIKYLDLSENNLSKFPIIQLKEYCFKQLNYLDLSKNKLSNFPIVFQKCVNLQELIMSENQLEQVTESIMDLYKLKSLTLDNNPKIKVIPDTLKKLKKLTYLSLKSNSIQEVPDAVGDLAHLQKLFLDNNKIKELKPSFFRLKKLYCLSLKENQISELLDQFHKLKRLEELFIAGNQLKQLPNSIGTHIQILNYQKNPIQIYPCRCLQRDNNKILFQNKNMKILKQGIIQNKLMLTSLSFKNNILEEIPRQVIELKNLTQLNMSNNKIKTIPQNILNLFTLKSLLISDNLIQSLPQFISNFNELKEIDVYSQYFVQFPKTIQKLKLTKIRFNARIMDNIKNMQYIHSDKVDFSDQRLTFLHSNICELINVDVIIFTQNQLQSLPDQFCQLNIRELQIIDQRLKCLPQNFGKLQKISKLNLNKNQIDKLPESFSQLSNLKEFHIQDNKLKSMPSSINKISNLRRLNISKNNFQSLEFELQGLMQLQANQNQIKEITKNLINKNCKVFALEKNQIRKIPKILQKMKQLALLRVSQNPIEEVECTEFCINRGDKKTKQMINEYCQKVDSQRKIIEIEYS